MSNIHCSDGEYFFDIDFSRYTLLMARGISLSGIGSVEAYFSRDATNKYTLSVAIVPTIAHVLQGWVVLFLTPKLSENATVSLEIERIVNF